VWRPDGPDLEERGVARLGREKASGAYDTSTLYKRSPANLFDSTTALCNTGAAGDVLFNLSTLAKSIDYHTSTPYLPFLKPDFNNKTDTLGEMDPLAPQDPIISITSNCGNVRNSNNNNVWNNCDISVADEKRAVLEWLSPLEPRERHQAIGMDRMPGVGDWLLDTNEFTQWNKSDEGAAKPILFCYGNPGVGKTYLRYGW